MVSCGTSPIPVVHDLTGNFRGTTDEARVRAWVIDHDDDPAIPATVLFSPLANQPVPTAKESWGDVKAMFR